jgi:hypothetical protein
VTREEARRELAAIVGEDRISWEPALLDSYVYQSLPGESPDIWLRRPVAVVLPGSLQEVQEVVRACARHGLRCVAHATGWGAFSAPNSPDVVQLDLSAMNRIISIDGEKGIAVVEPGVCAAQLQAEAMKVGLNVCIPPPGPCEPLLALAHPAKGFPGAREANAGEVVYARSGSCPKDWEWEKAGMGAARDGGIHDLVSGRAVVTKCAVALHAWPGTSGVKMKGLLFDAEVEVPDVVRFLLCFFPDERSMAEAGAALEDGGVGRPAAFAALAPLFYCLAPNLFERVSETEKMGGLVRKALRNAGVIMLTGESREELDHKRAELVKIVDIHGGFLVGTSDAPHVTSLLFSCCFRSAAIPRAGRGWSRDLDFLRNLTL